MEPISSVIRVWQDGQKYGDAYEWVATIRWIDRNTIEILGYTKPVTPSIWKAVIREAQSMQIKTIIAKTYPEGAEGAAKIKTTKHRPTRPTSSDTHSRTHSWHTRFYNSVVQGYLAPLTEPQDRSALRYTRELPP